MKRRGTLIVLGAGLAAPRLLLAQQANVRRIGFLGARSRSIPSRPDPAYDAFVQGMRELGYVEGRNLVIEWRFADGDSDRLPGLATDLVRSKPEVIVTHGTPATLAARKAAGAIPIVFAALGDPVRSGVVASLARPGGNLTGLSLITADLASKHIELIMTLLPKAKQFALLWNSGNPATRVATYKKVAEHAKVKLVPVGARTRDDLPRAFDEIARLGVGAAFISADTLFAFNRRSIVELAAKHRIPTLHYFREDVLAGALISYGQNLPDYYRRSASYVDRILKGAKPADLPIEQPTRIHLAINRKTAKTLGITVPNEFLLRADELIE